MNLRNLFAGATILILIGSAAPCASADTTNPALLKVQLANIRASIVEKDEKTKRIAHVDAELALLAVGEVELELKKLAIDDSADQNAAVDAAIINMRTAVKQFLGALP
ncbi:hypothetical protein [Mesorhizobium sp. GbtcB19]|uniref:hypothetical protein n=1 Tax=Mesorhizobium sp. GbtcB19 TaxID=2824764 RepID=UPI001C3047F8|nr:hypothetical protein [Mesorhizobium sp. GbtcB19]